MALLSPAPRRSSRSELAAGLGSSPGGARPCCKERALRLAKTQAHEDCAQELLSAMVSQAPGNRNPVLTG